MELKWTSKALSDLARLYDFLVLASKRGLRANGTKTYVKEIIRCLYLNLELSVPLLKYPLAT
ncbi:plasmid stabilization protein [Escherichia coli]|nr:plasmid stabilization protein [Escherichia coli]